MKGVELVIEEDHLLVILGHHAILVLHRHASLVLPRHAMQDPGLTVVIIIPLQKEGITQGLQLLLLVLFFSFLVGTQYLSLM